jgi:hypothetical protein
MEEVILPELLTDNLTNVPIIFLIIVRVTVTFLCEREKLCGQKKKYSDSETSSKESDSTSDAGATTWVKEDKHQFRTSYWKSRGETNSM